MFKFVFVDFSEIEFYHKHFKDFLSFVVGLGVVHWHGGDDVHALHIANLRIAETVA
jgi:hypothetical protein